MNPIWYFALPLLFVAWALGEKEARFFEPTPGFVRAKELTESYRGKVASIRFQIKDAFEGAESHTEAEDLLFKVGNKLHINTRESTIRRRLLFREGDTITADLLRETEKNLRGEEFLADAILEVKRQADSSLIIQVTTYDQWTAVPAIGITKKQKEWVWWFGPVESNLIGTGQRLGFFVSHDLERDSRWIDFNNSALTKHKIRFSSQYAWLSDGYSYAITAQRPLLTRTDHWGFSLSSTGMESSENYYLSGNDLDRLDREGKSNALTRQLFGKTNLLGQWGRVGTHRAYAGITRSFGYQTKTSITPYFERKDRYDAGVFKTAYVRVDSLRKKSVWDSLGLTRPALPLNLREDEILGISLSLYRYQYKTVQNFRNLKWSENLETGWRLSSSLGRNQNWLKAKNDDWVLSHSLVYNDAWMNTFFVNTNASLKYFFSPKGNFADGTTSENLEVQWKPMLFTSSVISGQYDHLFANTGSQLLPLGEESGLIGFPNFYYSGKARFLGSIEQRFFPPFEMGTVVPALAVFLNAGNTFSSYETVDLRDLHYALGLGLRLGATRSVQKVINHINVVWPLGEKNLDSWSWGIRASKNL